MVRANASNSLPNSILLSNQTASGSATIDFTSFASPLYSSYKIYLRNIVPATNAVHFIIQFSTDNGVTWISTNYVWAFIFNIGAAASNATGQVANNTVADATSIYLTDVAGTAGFINGEIEFYNINVAKITTMQGVIMNAPDSNNNDGINTCMGTNTANTTINAIRFKMSSGNIASGTLNLYGIIES